MTEVCDLKDRACVPCQGGTPPLDAEASAKLKGDLHADWQLDAASKIHIKNLGSFSFESILG